MTMKQQGRNHDRVDKPYHRGPNHRRKEARHGAPAMQQGQLKTLQKCVSRINVILSIGFALILVTTCLMLQEMNLVFLSASNIFGSIHNVPDPYQKPPPPMTILVQLSGEFGNHLSKLAYGRALQLWLQEEYGVSDSQLVLRHQGGRYAYKWEKTQADLKRCFPWTQSLNFSQGNDDPIYQDFVEQYSKNQTSPLYKRFHGINGVVDQPLSPDGARQDPHAIVARTLHSVVQAYRKADSSPFILYADQFVHGNHFFLELYYSEFRKTFEMSLDCCPINATVPPGDETVVVRNQTDGKGKMFDHVPCFVTVH